MSEAALNTSTASTAALMEQLRDRIENFEGLTVSGRDLQLVKEVHRRFCNIYLFRLSSKSSSPDMVVKVPIGHGDLAYRNRQHDSSFVDRPRLFERADPDFKAGMEYEALLRIQTSYDAVQDPRFGVVRVYDMLPQQKAMVMQWIDQPSLRKQLYAAHRLGNASRARHLETAFVNSGAWLCKHHQLPPLDHCRTRNTSRDDYLVAVERFMAYLVNHVGNGDELRRMHQQINKLATEHLPSAIPTGQVHGDFAPRNVFVDPSSSVSVFDTLGRFEAPIYEDIAKMLMTVNASGPRMISHGLLYDRHQLKRFEQAFLEGYFVDQEIPLTAIRLFLAQLILEHWSAVVYQHRQQRGVKRFVKGARRAIWQSGFHAYLREILFVSNDRGQ